MINKKVLVLSAYPIVNPQHGGQKRTKAIVDYYQTIFQEVRHVGVYNSASYADAGVYDHKIESGKVLDELRSKPFNAAVVTGESIWRDGSIRVSLIKMIRQFKPDVIQIEQPFMYRGAKQLVEAAGLEGVEYILSSQNIEFEMKRGTFEALGVAKEVAEPIIEHIKTIEIEFTREAAAVIAVSEGDAKKHLEMGAKSCEVILNGISVTQAGKEAVRKWQRYKKNEKVDKIVLFVGSAHAPNWKGFEKMIGLDTGFLPKSSRLIVAGGVSDYFKNSYKADSPIWERMDALGRVEEDDLAALINAADVIILPIISGGGSNLKTAEAIVSGKRIVATKFALRGYEEFEGMPGLSLSSDPVKYRKLLLEAVKDSSVKRTKKHIEATSSVLWVNRMKGLQEAFKKTSISKPTVYIDVTRLYKTRTLTGIQRVVRSLLPLFLERHSEYETRAIFYDDSRGKFAVFSNQDMTELATSLEVGLLHPTHEIEVSDILNGDIFFDLDIVWDSKAERGELYRRLKEAGASIFTYIYDLTPILFPDQTHPETRRTFPAFLDATCRYADLVLTDSRSSELDFNKYLAKNFPKRVLPTVVTRLGSDFPLKAKRGLRKKEVGKLLRKKYLLFVGTLEPRKQQSLLHEAFHQLSEVDKKLHLVFVGRKGWLNDGFIARLTSDPLFGKRIHWLEGVDDYELEKLYRGSYLNVYLSNYEGYGLPVAEALGYGRPTIASKNSSIYEVGTDFADYIKYGTKEELVGLINMYLNDSKLYKKKSQKITKFYKPTTWDSVFKIIDGAIRNHISPQVVPTNEVLQHVCISIRPDDFARCVERTDKFSSFVKEYIVITRKDLISKFKSIPSRHRVVVIDERKLLGGGFEAFNKAPHQQKNWLLRAALLNIESLDEQFIMLDDDNLPLVHVDLSQYIENGRYKAYYYNDLLDWKHNLTSYDIGQHESSEELIKENLQLLSYSSHCPQVINKKIYREVIDKFYPIAERRELDEWSTYFNYATTYYPEIFEKRVYETMNWPAHPGNWKANYIPGRYTYENFYEYVYEKNGFFEGIRLDSELGEKEKIKREISTLYEDMYAKMEQVEQVCSSEGMIHGPMLFMGDRSDRVVITGIPFLFFGTKDVTMKFRVGYKIINPEPGAEYVLVLQNSAGSTLGVALNGVTDLAVPGLVEGEAELPVQVAIDPVAIKDLNFIVKKNDRDMAAGGGRYDSMMLVGRPGQSLKAALSAVDADSISQVI